ncbi:vesicular, overexpressed in cancer, prosurvival protein 1-like [Branchiostoma floridae]|uniref:WW domain binding protein VOPP1 n=1 Tax=Branchiostoma floridae TaxID=7739 RepID=A0A9J7N2X3_BRAFL|nr:vesicular, overexpressed in cancer, prosurvival protein 1-like [Branchiostoma floridae]
MKQNMATTGFLVFVIIAAGFSEVHGRYCYSDYSSGEGNYFNCNPGEYCCGTKCCMNSAGAFYSLWYFWLIVLMGIILCSSGGFWYRRRYYQQRIVTTIERQGQNGFVARTTHTMEELPSDSSYCAPRAVAVTSRSAPTNAPNVPVYPIKYTITHTGPYPYPYPYPMPPPNGPPPPYTQAVIGPQAATGHVAPAPPGVVNENCSSSNAAPTATTTTIISG